ncbi:MAG: substrate-binding domain-containing protein [Muribaculaceae bacterium]|nr:substrate-binding domain-containing protein [Muribaculaceae bacterium]
MKEFVNGLLLICCIGLLSCGDDEPNADSDPPVLPPVNWTEDNPISGDITPPNVTLIEGLNEETFPVIDGSDSTQPLRRLLAATLAGGYGCSWGPSPGDGSRILYFTSKIKTEDLAPIQTLSSKLKENNTHPSYNNLIDGKVELIICARESSEDEQNYAQEKEVTLIEKPIAYDSFAFLLNRRNKVNNLSHEQVVAIYSGKITNWNQVGGDDEPIKAFTRNRNSGSQEKMDKLVMKDTPMIDVPELRGGSMMAPYLSLEVSFYGIAYSPYYYYLNMSESVKNVKAIAINSVPPTREHIRDKSYPYVSEVVAVIRSDTPADSYAKKIFDYLTTSDGKKIIEASGYVAN